MKISNTNRTGSPAAKAQEIRLVNGAETEAQKPFVKLNFIFMGVSLLLIIVGFLLMTGSSNSDPAHFNYDIFSTRRIVVGPAMAFIGFVAMAFSIVYSPKSKSVETADREVTTVVTEEN